MTASVEGEILFAKHFAWWTLLGLLPTRKYRQLYLIYSICVNILITIGYPLHLIIGLFLSSSMYDIVKNLSVTLTCFVCSAKTFVIWLKFRNVQTIMEIIERQGKRISLANDEWHYYKFMVFKNIRQLLKVFVMLYGSGCALIEVSVLCNGFMGNWDLMFPGYFPFDPFSNTKTYILVHMYQFLGIAFQILQNVVNDSFAAMQLALFSGQIHALGMRVAKLGQHKGKTESENNQELLACIEDHKDLLSYRFKLEEVISLYMFCQILITSLNMCVTVLFVIFFSNDLFTLLYYFVYFLSVTVQIFPMCYYGTMMEIEFRNLTYALFSSNWMDQNGEFKQNLGIFAETTMKPLYMTAWLFRINLNLFVMACKNAYSLFALVMNVK